MSGSFTAGAALPSVTGNSSIPRPLDVTDAEEAVWGYFRNQVAQINTRVYEQVYPEIRYTQLVPIEDNPDPWVQLIQYTATDGVGQAQWIHANANDVPLVETQRQVAAVPVHMAGIGYGFNEEELAVAARMGMPLQDRKAALARRAAEEFIDRVALFGDASLGFSGLINSAAVTAGSVSGGLWTAKTPAAILADINAALVGINTASATVEMADTILLPTARYMHIANTARSDTSDTTILEFLRRNNAYTIETGAPLTVRGLRGLETAGSGGTMRMVTYRRSPDVVAFHRPMPFQFLQPWRKGPMRYEVPGRFRIGGVDVRRPGAFRYSDGI